MGKTETRTFAARYDNLATIDQFIANAAEEAGFGECAVHQVQLAVDEACSNIIEHAYGGEGPGVIECTYQIRDEDLTVILRDEGRPFDPETVPEPDLDADLEERTGGGLGLYFMRQLMDEVEFDFESETGNVLTLVKNKESPC